MKKKSQIHFFSLPFPDIRYYSTWVLSVFSEVVRLSLTSLCQGCRYCIFFLLKNLLRIICMFILPHCLSHSPLVLAAATLLVIYILIVFNLCNDETLTADDLLMSFIIQGWAPCAEHQRKSKVLSVRNIYQLGRRISVSQIKHLHCSSLYLCTDMYSIAVMQGISCFFKKELCLHK
jgi:hypothetical protein